MSGTILAVPTVPVSQAPKLIPTTSGSAAATADKFESMALAAFLKPIFATMGKADAPFGGGSVEKHFQPFLIDAIAKSMEARGGLGLKPMIESALAAPKAASSPTAPPLPLRTTTSAGTTP
jgi:Rod binding domain-containing protein